MIQYVPGRACVWICACLVLVGAHNLLAQSDGSRAKDEAAIRQAGKDYLAAIERGDSKALADAWTPDGTYADEAGRMVMVRELLAKSGDLNNGTGARSNPTNVKVRFVAEDVAIEEGAFDSLAVDGDAPEKGCYTAIWVRRDGRWKLDNVRESPMEIGSHTDQLASLDVFAGEWSGEVNRIAIHVSARWGTNKKFLCREITMASGKASLGGRQEIGWDPLAQQVRSWTFSDDGSYCEGVWSLEGNKWMVLATRVLPDGSTSQATQIYKFPDKNTLVWKSIGGSIDGQPTDDFEVVLKRSTAN